MKKVSLTILFILTAASGLPGCNLMQTHENVASACEQGIKNLNNKLSNNSEDIHQTNISRANSLLVAARVQLQFAEYPGCIEKVNRAQQYLSGQQSAVIGRLSI